jgi:predicted  nucleic acid-binding Zn-ribbon protein
MEPSYKTWVDKGGNVGVQCLECNRVFWTGGESTIGCPNCQLMASQNVLQTEQNAYNPANDYPCSQPPQLDASGQEMV